MRVENKIQVGANPRPWCSLKEELARVVVYYDEEVTPSTTATNHIRLSSGTNVVIGTPDAIGETSSPAIGVRSSICRRVKAQVSQLRFIVARHLTGMAFRPPFVQHYE